VRQTTALIAHMRLAVHPNVIRRWLAAGPGFEE
jgi:hypothetical protein